MLDSNEHRLVLLPEPLRILTPSQVSEIDRCLDEIEAFGQVTLIKQKGRLRFIEKTESVDANHLQ